MAHRSPGYTFPPHAGNGSSSAGAPGEGGSDEVTLRDLARVLWQQRGVVAACLGAVVALVLLYTLVKKPVYESSSMLYVDREQSTPQLGTLLGIEGGASDVANEAEILRSRTIALRVADRLMRQQTVPGSDELLSILETDEDEPLTRYDVMRRLRESYVRVQPVSVETSLLQVVASSTQPEEARLVAAALAEEYVDYNRAQSRRRVAASRSFLDDMTARFRQQLEFSEDTLTTFLQQSEIVAPEEEVKQLLEQVKDLRQRQYEARLERAAAETQLENLQQRVAEIAPALAEQIASGTDSAIEGLKQARNQRVAQLEARYARNPSSRQDPSQDTEAARLEQEITRLQEQIDARARRIAAEALSADGMGAAGHAGGTQSMLGRLSNLQGQITSAEIRARVQETRLRLVNEELAGLTRELEAVPNKEVALRSLERTTETQREIYLSLVQRLQEASVAEQSELGFVSIVDEALVPEEPSSPVLLLNLVLGTLLGLVVGVGAAFVRHALDDKVHDPRELRSYGYGVLSVVPDMERVVKRDFDGRERVDVDGRSYSTGLITLLNPLAPAAEAYRRLRTGLQFSRPDVAVQTVLVTSAGPGEGKSLTSMNLAIAMAQAGRRTLYMDADLRRATGHKMVGQPREPGVVDVLFEPSSFAPGRFATGIDDLYVLPAGKSVPNPAEMISSSRMEALLRRLGQEFDTVVIDTPPVLLVADALQLAAQCDTCMLVCAADKTPWEALQRSVESLRGADAHLAGLVLNRYDAGSDSAYGYGYTEYYGERESRAT